MQTSATVKIPRIESILSFITNLQVNISFIFGNHIVLISYVGGYVPFIVKVLTSRN